jgi:hypothetical protein
VLRRINDCPAIVANTISAGGNVANPNTGTDYLLLHDLNCNVAIDVAPELVNGPPV